MKYMILLYGSSRTATSWPGSPPASPRCPRRTSRPRAPTWSRSTTSWSRPASWSTPRVSPLPCTPGGEERGHLEGHLGNRARRRLLPSNRDPRRAARGRELRPEDVARDGRVAYHAGIAAIWLSRPSRRGAAPPILGRCAGPPAPPCWPCRERIGQWHAPARLVLEEGQVAFEAECGELASVPVGVLGATRVSHAVVEPHTGFTLQRGRRRHLRRRSPPGR